MHPCRFLIIAFFLAAPVQFVHAWSYGVAGSTQRPGDSGNGCASCHGALPGGVQVRVQGDDGVLPGASARYSVIIENIGNASARGGFTAAITKDPGNQPSFVNVAGEPTATVDTSTQIVNNNSDLPLRLPTDGVITYLIGLAVPASATLGDEYTIYTVGDAGHQSTQVGWNFAPEFTLSIGAPTPESLSADQAGATTTEIPLTWAGSDQGEDFRVLRNTGDYPDSPIDAGAELVYEGAGTAATATGLTPGTRYFFAVWGKVPGESYYSTDSAREIAGSLPENPSALTVSPISASEIVLEWSGTSSEYRLLRMVDAFPASPDDPDATLVYEGNSTMVPDGGLASELEYHYRVWSKTPGLEVFSTGSADATWKELIHADRFEAVP
jgi:hypothetical protein